MLLDGTTEEERRELFTMVMTPSEARLTGDEELDSMPIPSWWHGEEEAMVSGQQAASQLAAMRPADVD
jgi:hypothetical protein